jgi:hypothetical protein
MKKKMLAVLMALGALLGGAVADELERGFAQPPHAAKPWVFWFWINGNISKEGITADLEALHNAGIGGLVWMEVSGMAWAPDGPVKGGTPQWHDCMQWAFRECGRLGLHFDLSVDFGYGSGGPHITPDRSMQKLYWSETEIAGGRKVEQVLPRPEVAKKLSAWLRPGANINPKVVAQIEQTDSYRDIAVLAIPAPPSVKARDYRIPELNVKDGTNWRLAHGTKVPALPPDAVTPLERVVDLTAQMTPDGRLAWDAPPGRWLILRCGHASNFKMTRPCPNAAIGLECDRLAATGIETHYDGFLKKIFTDAGPLAGKALTHVHVDSWEAGGQNWTATFPAEFRARRGYDVRPWLPVLAGRVVGSAELSERFLWDMRKTVSEMHLDNYSRRLRELARPFGIKFSTEAYGHLCIDNLAYGGACDFPISEFWSRGDGFFPNVQTGHGYEVSTKAMASVAHTYGRPVIGAEAFTSDRGWRDHPFTLKAQGDRKYCEGLNRMIFHLSAHQAYANMIPGLTHRKWGQHIDRFNTWFTFMQPWMDYLTRCQYLLQQGGFVADVCYFPGEGAPLPVDDVKLELPAGFDYDQCSSELLLKLSVQDGRLVLPSGANYRYLVLPDADRLTVPVAQKIRELAATGARIIGGPRPKGSPGLTDFPRCDTEVATIAAELWDGKKITTGKAPAEVFAQDQLAPDFVGQGLSYIHRRAGEADIYFVANGAAENVERLCSFRVTGKRPEFWQPETGRIIPATAFEEAGGVTRLPLSLDPCGSIFVVFRSGAAVEKLVSVTRNGEELLRDAPTPAKPAVATNVNTFTLVAWVKPAADTVLPREAVSGTVGRLARNDVLYPPPGHEVWGAGHAGAGFAVGRNGVCVHEHSAAYFSTSLASATPVTDWTHVAIVYRDATPTLFLNGKQVRTGLKSPREVHPGLGVTHERKVANFNGELAGLQAFDRALTDAEIVELAKSRPAVKVADAPRGFDYMSGLFSESGDYVIKTAAEQTRQLTVTLPPPQTIAGPWQVTFDPKWGGPAQPVTFSELTDWSKRSEDGIKYFSGTAVYRKGFELPQSATRKPQSKILLDLGSVEVMARVRVNGQDCGIVWKPPYRVDITGAARAGQNELEISVVNLWVNRLVGDEQLPVDAEWKDFETLLAWPAWFTNGTQRPSGRYTFTTCRHYRKDTPLLPSGLLGPVTIHAAAKEATP